MNLKYYLRGLGVGIVVTALVLGIGLGNRKETLSNEEIKERARALGMVEESITVAEAAQQEEEKEPETEKEPVVTESPEPAQSTASPEPTVSPEPEVGEEVTASPSPEASASAVSTPAPSAEAEPDTEDPNSEEETAAVLPQTSPDNTDGEIVDITVNPGEGSLAISRKLEETGLIDDAAEYDAYLCDNGYHTKLRAGTHRIPMGSTREEIAKLLCR